MASTAPSNMSTVSVVFIERDEAGSGFQVFAPGNVPGVDWAHAHGVHRKVTWHYYNRTDEDLTVKMRFDSTEFGNAFKSTSPVAADDGGAKVLTVSLPANGNTKIEGDTKSPSFGGWELTFELLVNDTVVDPGLRIDDGTFTIVVVAVIAFTLGVAASFLLMG